MGSVADPDPQLLRILDPDPRHKAKIDYDWSGFLKTINGFDQFFCLGYYI